MEIMKNHQFDKLGIIAGKGNLPRAIIQNCKDRNIECFVVNFDTSCTKYYDDKKIINVELSIGDVADILSFFQKNQVKHLVLAGKVNRPNLLTLKVDKLGKKLIANIIKNKILGDSKLLDIVTEFLEKQGLAILPVQEFTAGILVSEKKYTKRKISANEIADIKFGINAAKKIGEIDLGQAVIIADGRIIIAEDIAGTNELIKKYNSYRKEYDLPEAILVKATKPQQDKRIDLPSIGLTTIKKAIDSGIKIIALEAGSSFIIDYEKVIDLANEHNIGIIGVYII
jgi:UDP-2,3-diacylglucosamine hydrolase